MAIEPLFNARVLAHYLRETRNGGLETPSATKAIFLRWIDALRRGDLARLTESQAEQAFNNQIFCAALGYDQFAAGTPEYSIKPKARGNRNDTPDFVLGRFSPGGRETWVSVGEIKGANVGLDQPQLSRRGKETPVEQAFRYATGGRPGIDWVIVTNFREIRLYRNGYTASYHSWQLTDLEVEEKSFEFYAIMRPEGLLGLGGDALAMRVLKASISTGKAITEGFYSLYNAVQVDLVKALGMEPAAQGMQIKELYGKAHKALNRLLFAAFCEDHPSALLPPETLANVAGKTQLLKKPGERWEAYKSFFDLLNTGGGLDGRAINAFNGGLFKKDPFLERVTLPNSLFEKRYQTGRGPKRSEEISGIFGFHVYDFASDLNAQALGAIFEQSLKDLPEGEARVRGAGQVEVSVQSTGGVFYTPGELTKYLTGRSLELIFADLEVQARSVADQALSKLRKPANLRQRELARLDALAGLLGHLKILDPACGSGAFLVEVHAQLAARYTKINATRSTISSTANQTSILDLDRIIVRQNLHGYDILAESVEISRLSIWLSTAKPGERLESLDNTVVCRDALSGETHANFDMVIGNPPWGAKLDGWGKEELARAYPEAGNEKDSFAIFVMRAFQMLKPGGILAFVLPNSWLTVEGYASFRRWVLEHFAIIEITNLWKIFDDVNHDACLLVARKRPKVVEFSRLKGLTKEHVRVRAIPRAVSENHKRRALAASEWYIDHNTPIAFQAAQRNCRFETIFPPPVAALIDSVDSKCTPLSDVADITVGIQVYHHSRVSKEFIKKRGFHSSIKISRQHFGFIEANEVQRFRATASDSNWLKYSDKLHDKRALDHYKRPRILVQQIFWRRLSCALQEPKEPLLYLNSLFAIYEPRGISLDALLALLNSRYISATYERRSNRLFGDKFPKVSRSDLASLPIPTLNKKLQRDLGVTGRALQRHWSALRTSVDEAGDELKTYVPSASLASFDRFWECSEAQFLAAVTARFDSVPAKAIRAAFSKALQGINMHWAEITKLEEDLDRYVRRAYRISVKDYELLLAVTEKPDISWLFLGPRP